METVAAAFEVMARYGVFDIVFGVGILAFLRKLFRGATVDEIEGVVLLPRIEPIDGFLEIRLKNTSRDPLYLYRASFRPGYPTNAVDRSSPRMLLRSLIFTTWRRGQLPRVTEPSRTTRGDYLLQASNPEGEPVESLFLEPMKMGDYVLGIEPVASGERSQQKFWDGIFEARECGEFRVHFVHGTKAGILELQI